MAKSIIKSRYDGDTAELSIFGEIGSEYPNGVNPQVFVNELKGLKNVTKMDIHVHSPGGDLFGGLMMYNALKQHPAEKTFFIDGIAASITSVICMAPGTVIMPDETSWFMVHDPSTVIAGRSEDLRQAADRIDQAKKSLIAAYCEKTGLSSQDVSDLMTAETWMQAKEAKRLGFCDEISQPLKIAAHAKIDLSRFKNLPNELQDKKQEVIRKKMEDKKPNVQTDDSWKRDKYDERDRVMSIKAICKHYPEAKDLEDKAIKEGWDEDRLRLKVLDRVDLRPEKEPLSFSHIGGIWPAHEGKPFRTFGDFLMSVKNAGTPGRQTDPRLFYNAGAGQNESVPSEGGFLVQSDFTNALLESTYKDSILAPRCFRLPISGNSNGVQIPMIDERSRVAGSRFGGVQVYWTNEGGTVTEKKPKYKLLSLSLNKLMGLFYATDELLQESAALETVTTAAFSSEIAYTVDNCILNGTGAGQPLGIVNSNALVTVSKESGQLTKTILFENIVNMWSRLWAQGEGNAIWVINRDVIPQLFNLTIGTGTSGQPVFMPAGGVSGQPYSTIFGRPVISMEQCPTLGTVGDIMLIDPSQYIIADKGGINAQQSIHVRFIYDEMTFRFTYRVDGQPLWMQPLTPASGSANTLSPFVALETR